jgi:AcrR family transcriptional regulator
MGRPREHDESTRAALLDAAEHLLARGETLSVRALAEATSTTTRAVYSTFGSMDVLHQELLVRAFGILADYVRATPTTKDPAADLVRSGVDGFRRFALEHPNLFRVAFERAVPDLKPTPEAATIMRDALKALAERVQRCKDTGVFPARTNAKEVVWQCHAFCHGLASVELLGWLANVESPERVWRDGLTALVNGIRSGSGRSGASR